MNMGKVSHLNINDIPVGRDVDGVLRLLQAFQYKDEHEEGESSEYN